MNRSIGVNVKRFSTKLMALLICFTLIIQMFSLGDVALGASPYYFRGYDVQNITSSTFSTSGATADGTTITMTDPEEGEAIGFVALDEAGHDISASIDLGGLEIDFDTTTIVAEEGAGGAENDVPTVRIDFCGTNYSNVISTLNLAKPNNAVSGSVTLSSNASIPVGTRSIIIYMYGTNTSGENTVVFQNTSFIIHDAAAPACSVDYNHNWTNAPFTVTITASDSDSGLEGIYKDGEKVSATSPYTFIVSANTSFSAYSKDYAGKVSATQNVAITNIDTSAPAAPASLTLSHDTWTNTDVTVTVPALGATSGSPERYIYRLNGGSWTDLPAGFAVTDSGQYAIDVAVADAAGNVSSSISDIIYIDKLAPSIDHVTTEASAGSVEVTVETSDAGLSGISATKYAEGEQNAAYFASGGTAIVDGHFTVSAGGVFTIYVADNAGNYDIGQYTLNTAPTLGDIPDMNINEDTETNVVLDVADGESALSELIVTAEASDPSIISTVRVNQSDEEISLDLTPAENMSGGPVTITVTVKDDQDEQATDTFQVTVLPVNDDPVAVDDEGIVTGEDTSVKIDVLANDYDTADGDTLTITDAGTPEHGTTSIAAGQIRYTPSADYNGEDQFTYTISDGHGGTASATVYISATAVNDAPVAWADTTAVEEDGSVLVDVLANDTDIDKTTDPTEAISLVSAQNGAHGTATVEDGKVRYAPAANYFGKDTFTYVIEDNGGLQSTGTVTVTITGVEDAPYYANLHNEYTIDEDSTDAEITFDIKDVETPANTLMLQAVSLDEMLVENSGITVTGLGDGSDAVTLNITPVKDAFGDVTISLSLGDGFATVTQTFVLHIAGVNDAPVAVADQITYPEDGPAFLIDVADLVANDTDIDGDALSFAGIVSTTSVGTLTQIDEDTLEYTPAAEYDGSDSFTYTVSDGHGGTATGTCVLKATPTNDAPTITIPVGTYDTDEDTASGTFTFSIGDTETAAADLIVKAYSSDTDKISTDGITIVNNGDGTCTFSVTPAADANGSATITITVSDGSLTSSDHITFTINPTPDAPVAVNDKVYVSISGRQTFAVLNNDRDVDGDTLTVVSWDDSLLNGALTFNEDTQKFTYYSANGEVGTGTFTYTVSDGDITTADSTATVTLDIHSLTHPPDISMIHNQYLGEDTSTGSIPFTVTDVDLYDTATISVTSSNTTLLPVDYENNIIVTNNGGGSYTLRLIPAANQNGTSWITVTATDSTDNTDSTTFLLTVYPDNDPPNAVNDTFTIDEDTTATLTLLTNDSDPEGDAIWVNSISWPSHGYLYRSGASYVYVPYGDWNGTETLTYSITDGQSSDTATITINVTPVNDAPVNYSNWVTLPNEEGQSAAVNVLSGDYDPDGDTVRLYQIIEQPAFGTAEINTETGYITYTRTSESTNSNGADQVKYRIIDRDTATGDYLYADAYLYIGIVFHSSLWTDNSYTYCFEDDAAFNIGLHIHNPNSVGYTLELNDTTALGTLSIVDNDTVRFTPAADQNGSAWIEYTVSGGGESATGYIYIRVYPVNDPPVIDSAPESVSCDEDSAGADFTVTFHDADCADSDLIFYAYARNASTDSPVVLTIDITVDRDTGTADVSARPVANANGSVDIVVGVSDGISQAEHTVHMTVNPIDDAPVPVSASNTLYEDTDVTFDVLTPDSDVDGDGLIVSIEEGDGPAHGTATVHSDGTITYVPDEDYYGSDSLTFTVTDDTAEGLSSTETATFTVIPVNDQPVISNLNYYQSTKEDTPKDVTLTVTDVDNDLSGAASYTITSSNTDLVPNESISITHVSGYDMKITLTPEENAFGSTIISIIASDGELTAEAEFKLTVEPVNDVPVAANDTASVNENVGTTAGTTSVTINLTNNDTDIEDASLQVVAISDISIGSVVNNKNGTVTYSVDGDYNGTATFNYTVMDSGGATDTASVTVTIVAQNDPPRAVNDSRTIVEDNSVTIAVLTNDSDVEGDTLSITDAYGSSHGTTEVSGTDIIYTPDENYYGSDSFWYDISDGNGGTASARVNITITPVNDAPGIVKYEPTTGEWTMDEDTTESFNFLVSDPETATGNLIITIDSKDKNIIQNTGIVLTTNAEGYKIITVTPQENQYGTVPVEFRVTDGALTTTVTWNITIAPVNDAPVIDAPAVTTTEDMPVSSSVTAEDAENDALTFTPGMAPSHGSVVINTDGTYTYTPAANYSGEDSFGVYVSDGEDLDYGIVNVTVTPVNDKPDAVSDTGETSEDTPVTIPVLGNDTDADTSYGDTLVISSVGTPAHGTAEIAEGGITYTPAENFNGTDVFTYIVRDSDGETDLTTVTVTVGQVNDDPVAVIDEVTTNEDTSATIDVLANDTDVDTSATLNLGELHLRSQFSISLDDNPDPSHGGISVVDGKIVYVPNANWFGEDTFTYWILDGHGGKDEGTVTVTVNSVNDLPVFDTNPANMALTEDLENGSSSFAVSDVETAGVDLNVTVESSSNTALVAVSDVTITKDGDGNRTVTVNPRDNKNGTANIKLRVTDADGGYAEYTFTVTVAAVNDVPAAQNDTASTNENTAVTINVLANDDVDLGNEGDTLTLLTVSSATYGTVAIVNNKAVYTPDANRTVTESYTDTFTYTMQDASEATSGATVTVTVTPVNDAPIITDPMANASFNEDTAGGTGEIAFAVTDEEDNDDGLSVTAASSNPSLIPISNITITNPEGGDGSERTVQAVAVADGYGSADITLTVTDAGGKTDSVTFTVTVNPVDDPLGAGTMDYTVVEDVQKQLMVLEDADVDDPSYLTITQIVTPASHGTVTIAGDGKSLYYITDLNSNEADTFVYRVHDAFGEADYNITANITVTPVNDAPVVTMTGGTEFTTFEGIAVNDIPFTITDVDNDVDTLVLSASSSNPVLVLNGLHIDAGTGEERTIDVQPYRKWNGTTTITITAKDADNATGTASFTFIVNSVNEAPVANNDTFTIQEDTLTFLDVLDNDTDGDLETNPDTEHISVKTVIDEDPNATITSAGGSGVNIQPNANYNGPVTFTYIAEDASGAESNTATVTVTVNQVNDAPVADDEPDVTTNEDTAVTIDVLDGDTDIDQDESLNANPEAEVLSISIDEAALLDPSHGSISVVDGKIVYTPNLNYNGTDSFEYNVDDGEALDTGLVTVTIAQVNDAPVAVADSATTNEDTAKTIDVLVNDTDVDTEAGNDGTLHYRSEFSISLTGVTTAPAHGSIEVVDGKIVYTPDANWYGVDTFTYFILDGHGGSNEGTVTVTVNSVNDLPVFDTNPADMELTEDLADGSSSFSVSDVETAGADLNVTVESSSNPTLVAVSDVSITEDGGGDRTVTVNPKDNQNGTADIKLRVTDANGGYREYTFTVTVAAVNDAPIGVDTSRTIDEDTSSIIVWTSYTSDVDIATNADSIGVTTTTQAAHGSVEVTGTVIIYTSNGDWNGVDSFVYTVTDSAEATDTGTITITVNQVNDPPVADDEPDVTTNEDTPVTIDVLNGDTDTDQKEDLNADPEAEVLSISIDEAELLDPSHGSIDVVDGKIVYTPNENYNGTDTFEYNVDDGEALDTGLVTVTIAQVNDAPVAVADSATTNEDTAVTIDVLANDWDIDTDVLKNLGTLHLRSQFSISLEGITTAPAHGSIEVVDGKIVYDPDDNWFGEDTFSYWILDGHDGSAEGTVTVTVNSVNDLPVFDTNPADMELTEDLADGTSSFSVSDVETAGADLNVTVESSSNTTLVAVSDVTITKGTDGARTVTVNPKDNQNGTADIKLRVTDANGGYTEYTFTVTVAAVNDAPIGVDTSRTINEDTSSTIAWTSYTSDVDIATNGDSIGVTITTQAAHGTAEVSGNNIIYTPNGDWNGVDSFVYTVTDSAEATDTGTITITVNQVNDPPVADDEPDVTTNEDTPVTIDVLNGDTDTDQKEDLNADPEAEVLSISIDEAELLDPSHGSIDVVDGKIVYTPNENYNGTDSFEYNVDDGEALDTGLVTVTIAQVNDAPVAVADSATTNEDTAVTIDVLANDWDIDTDVQKNLGTLHLRSQFSISLTGITTAPAHGSIEVVDGKIVYTPDANWFGGDTFTYFILDGHGGSAEGTVMVTVNSVNDLPVFDTNPANMELTEDLADGSSSFSVSDVETAGADLSVTVESSSNTTLVAVSDVSIN